MARAVVCPTCGTPTPVAQMRALNRRRASGSAATLAGAPSATPTPLENATIPDSGTFQALAGLVDRPLDDATMVDDGLVPTLPPEDVVRPARLSSVDVAAAPDQGEPARRAKPMRAPGLLMVGDLIEGYRVDREVGRGGMGRVYKAAHSITGQTVALKMLLPELLRDERQRARFINEAQVLARFEHPNLVPLLNFFDTPRGVFIVMPFVEGITLEKMLRKQGRLPLDTVRDLVGQIASGLHAIHRQGIMHRDLKPSNILVRSDGRVRITDFGIARSIGAQRLTRTGMVVGTAEYLAPEQASGDTHDDIRSEIYSLAVLTYEMVTGRVPFRHTNAAEVLIKHVRAVPPPPGTIRADLPKAVEAVILRGLAKAPTDRHPSPTAFAEALEAAFDVPDAEAQPWVPTPTPPPVMGVPSEAVADDSVPTKPIKPVARPRRSVSLVLLQIVVGAALGAGMAAGAWYLLTLN